jgi:hypothetical protein
MSYEVLRFVAACPKNCFFPWERNSQYWLRALPGEPESSVRALIRFERIPEEGFPKGRSDGELRGPVAPGRIEGRTLKGTLIATGDDRGSGEYSLGYRRKRKGSRLILLPRGSRRSFSYFEFRQCPRLAPMGSSAGQRRVAPEARSCPQSGSGSLYKHIFQKSPN